MRPRLVFLGAALLVLVTLAALGLVVTEVRTTAQTGVGFGGPFGVTNRSTRSLCVDGVGVTVSGPQVNLIRQAVVDALKGIESTYTFLQGDPAPVVSAGCPPPVGLTEQPLSRKERGASIRGVAIPSPHELFVYIVPDDVFRRSFGDLPYGVASEELFCGQPASRNCASVTQGLYITSSISPEALREGLLEGLAFLLPYEWRHRSLPQPTPCPTGPPSC